MGFLRPLLYHQTEYKTVTLWITFQLLNKTFRHYPEPKRIMHNQNKNRTGRHIIQLRISSMRLRTLAYSPTIAQNQHFSPQNHRYAIPISSGLHTNFAAIHLSASYSSTRLSPWGSAPRTQRPALQ